MQAGAALCDGDLPVAERLLKAHLKANATDVAAMRMLAEVATRLGRYEAAEALLARCLELAPSFIGARHNYAIVLHRQNKSAEAIPHIEKLLRHDAKDPSYRNLMAASRATIGDYAGAIQMYELVLKDYPRQPKMWLGYGHALKTAGRRDDAVAAYRKCISFAPELGEAYWSLANLKNEPFRAEDIAAMQAQLAAPLLSDEDRLHFHYALGRACEDLAEYETSFSHYAEGARLRRAAVPYMADETSAQAARARAVFTPALFARHAGSGCQSDAPIFVVGLPRSGSTLIEQILASHSHVEGTMELPELAALARGIRDAGASYPEALADVDAGTLAALGERYLAQTRLYRKTTRPLFIDKMPNNFAHVGLIQLILPHAKIIDARRHPMAAGFSVFKQHFARGQNFSYDLTDIGRYYRDYLALMDHFDQVLPGRVHRVDYETMVADTEGETRRLLAHCGLAFEPACLRFWETERAVRTASSEQVRRPIFRQGLDQWRHYEPWLTPLAEALLG
jgi:tetratricopeptide (TPR) repeat protein